MSRSQLDLFPREVSPLPGHDEETRAIAAKIPAQVRLGTSSWSFPGWRGLVWPDEPGWNEARCADEGLAVYAQHPLFTTVGIDRSYYAPLESNALIRYASQIPPGFRVVSKMWEALSLQRYAYANSAKSTGSVEKASVSEENPHWLNVASFETEVLSSLRTHFAMYAGALVLEFPAGQRLNMNVFPTELAEFLRGALALPGAIPLAVEVRDRRVLTNELGTTLASSGASLCFSFHPTMPSLADQIAWAERHGLFDGTAPMVVRLMLPPGHTYRTRAAEMAPFDRIVEPQESMRRDVLELIGRAVRAGRTIFVIANNKAEGSAPLTLRALAERIARGA